MKRLAFVLLIALAILPGCDTGIAPDMSAQLAATAVPDGANLVESAVTDAIQRDGAADYLVYFSARPDLSAAAGMDWVARGRFVYESLSKVAADSQAPAIAVLQANNVKFQAFWIDNVIAVTKSDRATLNSIQAIPGVSRIIAHRKVGIIEPEKREVSVSAGINAVEPNIDHVGASAVWPMGIDGSGIVVANIDTGVRYTHNVLVEHYRGNNGDGTFDHTYNWYDPYTFSTAPLDGHGHGSHTMGTMVGSDGDRTNQTGMAPGARWIACRGCDTSSCTDTNLLACAQWIAAPTDLTGANPNPDRRPNIVNNSWGDCATSYDSWYQGVVDTWHAAGVYPVFSNGNASNCGYSEPPACNTVGNPARYGNVTGVGSTTQSSGQYANHSLRGPTDNPDTVNPQADPGIKPQVVAPGVDIRSSVATSDTAFESWAGTSMSAPHVTGLIALAWQAAPCLVGNYAATENLIEQSASPIPYSSSCGGAGTGDVPNNVTGWGEINALALVQLAQVACGPSGTVRGMAMKGDGSPIPNVAITVGGRSTKTAGDGTYSISYVPVGTYDLTAESFWYDTVTVNGLVVSENLETIQDIVMSPRATSHISGTVNDGSGHGWPLYAGVWITPPDGSDPQVVFSDPFTGAWAADVIAGEQFTYTIQAWLPGYQPVAYYYTAPGDQSGVILPVPIASCDMVGYQTVITPMYSSDFESNNGGLVASGTNMTMAWGVPTSGPGVAHSGSKVWATNLAGNYNSSETDYLTLPDINASGVTGDLQFSWWHYLVSESSYDFASVQASYDGGVSWNTVWGRVSGSVASSWAQVSVMLGSEYRVANLKIRFLFTTDSSVTFAGWYIDDVQLSVATCATTPAGVVAGFAYDGDTGAKLNGVLVTGFGNEIYSYATDYDPAVDDGIYFLVMPTGVNNMTGSLYGYSTANVFPDVAADTVTRQDFAMAPSEPVTVSGRVLDGNGQGWPLYAKIAVQSADFGNTFETWSDPFTGEWSMSLYSGYQYTATVTPVIPGYDQLTMNFMVDPDAPTVDFSPVSSTCTAPGMDPDTCALIPGGMIGGYVFEAATGDYLTGATVQAGTSSPWISIATPEDDAVGDGLFFVFASAYEAAGGAVPINASFPRMTPFSDTQGYMAGNVVRRDIYINEAQFAFDTPAVEFQFLAGQSGGSSVRLVNYGNGFGEFDLSERPVGVTKGVDAVGPRILTYYMQESQATSGDPLAVAISALGYTATAYYNDQHAQFLTSLAEGNWDLVIYDGSMSCDVNTFDALSAWVQGGGRLVFSCWQFWNGYRDAQILADMGVSIVNPVTTATPMYRWMDHGLFNQVASVPDWTTPYDPGFGLTGFVADATNGSYGVAGPTTFPAPGSASMIVGNDTRTVWRGIPDYTNTADVDADGILDAVELWANTVEYLLTGGITDVPWLSEDPVNGVLAGGESMPIAIAADSTGMPAGSYRAQVMVKTPNSRSDTEPLTVSMEIGHLMTVVQSANGNIVPGGETFVKHNGNVEVWFNADPGYHVQDVIINGVSYGRNDYMDLTGVTEDMLVTAEFEFTCYSDADCTHAMNDCVGICVVDTCERLTVKPAGAACGDQRDTDCSQPDTCNGAGTCEPNHEPMVVMCRQAGGVCDTDEYCTGHDAECPQDVKLTTECRGSKGVCDAADFCNGVDNDCPTDVKEPGTKQCRDLTGICDVPDFCNGVDNECPADLKLPATTPCRDAMGECDKIDFCNGIDSFCPADLKSVAECRPSVGACDKPDFCDGVNNRCPADVKLTTECRPVQGACDVPESCNGIDNTCPFDQKLPATTECGPSKGVCDAAEFCTGVDNACPTDVKLTTECRPSGGICDVADFCNGTDDACPVDVKEPTTTECRADGGLCDVADFCDGVNNACPVDAKEPTTTECRPSGGVCDVADFCDGIANACPEDVKTRAECRPALGVCDAPDFCNGVDNACPPDAKLPATTECRVSQGVCDIADYCNGVDNTCTADVKSVAMCRDAAGECDAPDFCNGADDACPVDVKLTTECRATRGVCDVAESCDGVGDFCPADVKLTTECRASQGVCDAAETCDGVDDHCPADVKLTTECRAADGVCDVAESCNGVDNTCPYDLKAPATTECGPAKGECDAAEFCTGVDNACPADVKLTTECRASAGDCDVADFCNGVDDTCPEDVKSRAECRAAGGVCDVAESCDGVENACPADVKLTTECRAVNGVCDVAEVCDGVANDCPADAFSNTATCDDGNPCSHGDSCDGTGAACTAETYACDLGPCDESVECDGDGGCIPSYKAIGTECDDGIACTTGETCQAGGQCVAETVLVCDAPPEPECVDADTSRVYVADGICSAEAAGCEYESHVFACESGCDAETGLCAEDMIVCPATTTPVCMVDQGYPVYDRDAAGITCYLKPIAAGTACDDADECTIDEQCDGDGACVGEPNPACVAEPERDVIEDNGGQEDTAVVQDTTGTDTAGDDLGPHNDDDDGCTAGNGSGTHLGWLMLALCIASLAIIRRRSRA